MDRHSLSLPTINRSHFEDRPMPNRISRLLLVAGALQALAAGCVQTRPARNAVFNEHQYLRKDFLVGSPTSATPDPGWWLKGTIVSVSTPNPLGSANYSLSPGIDSGAVPVRFVITEDKLQMVSTREMAATDSQSNQVSPAVVNAWPATNVDLMYYINLDGEITNQYVTNQEADWQQREWVQVDFDKNDMSDIAPLGEATWNMLSHCVDGSNVTTTLVPGSFVVDEANKYVQWTVSVTLPLIWDDATCVFSYGTLGQQAAALGKQSVTINLMYSLMRQTPLDQVTYKPLVVAEKDGIHHKYGFFPNITENLDPTSGMVASDEQVERFDPNKPIVWYFAQGFDPAYKHFFTDPGTGIVDRTNAVLQASGAQARVAVKEFDDPDGLAPGQAPRQYGDIRYNFLVWMNDQFSQETFAGVTEFDVDYRTGEMLSANIAYNKFAFQDYYTQRVNSFLQGVGAADSVNSPSEWPTTPTISDPTLATNCSKKQTAGSCPITVQNSDGSTSTLYCASGSTVPIQSVVAAAVHNGTSTVFGKMQQYLGYPTSSYGNLGPTDFIAWPSKTNDTDFFNAFYTLLPYEVYADPETNPYVIPEGGNGYYGPPASAWADLQKEYQFQQAAANLNAGKGQGWPYQGASGLPSLAEMAAGADNFRALSQAHEDYKYNQIWAHGQLGMRLDGIDSLAFENVADQAARVCGAHASGAWQTKEEWQNDIDQAYWGQVEFHEFGHSLGLTHNFMASIDAPHYPAYPIGGTPQATCDANPLASGCVPVIHASSIMEYNASIDRLSFAQPDWAPYDKAAIAWIYSNTTPNGAPCTGEGCGVSGQVDAKTPWNDPLGFDSSGNEKRFLFCNEAHMRYTPFCRQGDLGRTPSEIIANDLDSYEWEYQWRNLRSYHKFWDDSQYANAPAGLFYDLTRFVSVWAYDWSNSEITTTLRRIGLKNPCNGANPPAASCPNGGQSDVDYFTQLTNKFNAEVSSANQIAASYHMAMIEQAESERPAATTYDPYYGDVEQQGIILDKYFAMQNFAGMYPVLNFDPTQSAGAYIAWYEGLGDSAFNDLAQWGVTTMLGGVPNVFPYFQPASVAIFAQDTHDPAFPNQAIRNWIGGWGFVREQDFLSFFQNLAVEHQYSGPGCQDSSGNATACNCTTTATCSYDPRNIPDPQQLNQVVGPDGRRYIWSYIQDRNSWVVAEQDTHIVTNTIMLNYNSDVVAGQDDGNFPGSAYADQLPIKYTLDSFTQFN